MLPSIMEVSNSIEDQTVWMVAPASQTDDTIPPAEVLPRRTGGVSFACRSCRRLFPPLLRVSVCIDGMAGNNYMLSGDFLSRLFLAVQQLGAMPTCVRITIYFRHVVVNLASSERRGLQRSSPLSRRNSTRRKGAYSFLAPRRSRPL